MGTNQSKKAALHPRADPAILMQTDTGVIVRSFHTPTGEATYEFNPRYVPATSINEIASPGKEVLDTNTTNPQVLVAKRGAKNVAMKDKLVYVKRPASQSASTK